MDQHDFDERCEEEKNGGYKFAVTFLISGVTILYTIYNYIQNTPIFLLPYYIICLAIAGLFYSMIVLFSYFLVKGFLMECQDPDTLKTLHNLVPKLYNHSLKSFTISMLYTALITFVYCIPPKILETVLVILIIILIIIILILIGYCIKKNITWEKPSLKKLNWAEFVQCALIVGGLCFLLVCAVCFPPLQGHVTVDMESIYYKTDTQVPALVQVTGPNTNLSAFLHKGVSGNLSYVTHIISIEPTLLDIDTLGKRSMESNDKLIGTYLGNGKYNLFINTTNLTTGYYELTCTRHVFYERYDAKGFYLLNKS